MSDSEVLTLKALMSYFWSNNINPLVKNVLIGSDLRTFSPRYKHLITYILVRVVTYLVCPPDVTLFARESSSELYHHSLMCKLHLMSQTCHPLINLCMWVSSFELLASPELPSLASALYLHIDLLSYGVIPWATNNKHYWLLWYTWYCPGSLKVTTVLLLLFQHFYILAFTVNI